MSRVRIAYRQEGAARFVSHLDVVRAFERAARRAGLALTYSQGFNPRPKMTFAAPLAVGMGGCREYLDLELETEADPAEVFARLRACLPGGLVPVQARRVEGGPSLMSLVRRSRYVAQGKAPKGLAADALQAGLEAFLARGEIVVERESARGVRRRNVRPGIYSLQGRLEEDKILFALELKAGSAGNVRPDEVLAALRRDLPSLPESFSVWRTALLSREGRLLWDEKGENQC